MKAFLTLRQKLQTISEQQLNQISTAAFVENHWFTKNSISNSIKGIIALLEPTKLEKWINSYPKNEKTAKKIGVIMAGNIPFVGFHDALCVLMSDNILVAKLSSNDSVLPQFVLNLLIEIEPDFKEKIIFADKLKDIDALLATGSDNSARYFEYYFQKVPKIIRKSRTSIAILNGNESPKDLQLLGKDIFTYFGHGCRNVSSLLVPKEYNFNLFFESMLEFGTELLENNKYCNNYDYHKAIFLMNSDKFLDNNFLMIRESKQIYSPISVLHYHFYDSENDILDYINQNKEKIQCIVSQNGGVENQVKFGEAQFPTVSDYADGVDIMQFLNNI